MSRRTPEEAGFVLPLALAGVLLLWLSSLSLQAAVLHGRRLAHLERQGVQQRDQLASAAQLWADWFSGPGQCQRAVALTQWAEACTTDLPAFDDQGVQLQAWSPSDGGGTLALRLSESGAQARFALGPFGVRELD
ncbi:hypothetical protein [Synechococcus sp. W4D4]|uniref:hypothetical protein n=1 Tax=Synechococcus sp. W4D4 TaxID=3392294 RepID=UPI0039E72E09